MRWILPFVIFALLFSVSGIAQKTKLNRFNGKKKVIPFPTVQDYKPSGWLFGAGVTSTFQLNDQTFSRTVNGLQENYRFEPIMKPGAMLELGRYLNFDRKFIFDFVDFSAQWKFYRGGQNIERTTSEGTQRGENSFTEHYNSGSINLNNIIRVNDYNFVLNALGVNADYKFANSVERSSLYPEGIPYDFPSQFVAQIHYKIGWGLKADVDKVWLFSVETPVYNITPQTTNFSEFDYFNMPFRTLIFRVQFLLFRYDNDKCPPVNNPNVPAGFKNGYGAP
jgi:hypothetical protein